ncbi:Serine acetyltransferase [Planktothrix tepida]|uniref:Serine acetyltransferase n=1 Tax=Planktothrix tepida PCC 9214 TaxID=671072 RepID=A0A1J1LS09_9CYAN|nr:serine O-acetyltransferase [Planktothrix tepida]CAD5959390.1 Serine acetyltransferase [Planktothrix tepida]CUR34636.1 Serine acetyltransferase [Planktothrix tepida PCC 9214]
MLKTLQDDFRIIFERDPAARNWLEVLFCYPGLQALVFHRLAHGLYVLGLPFIPRLISHIARFLTGIEIHPGAVIGKGVFIDHGMGVVIGETAILGDFCLIYQGVTLGGTGKESGKRHPTLGENVVVGAGAKVLGNIQLGNNVRIGAGSVVLRDVPSNCTVVGVPGRVVYRSGVRIEPLEHGSLPDSEAQVIRMLVDRIELLEQQVQTLQQQSSADPNQLEAALKLEYSPDSNRFMFGEQTTDIDGEYSVLAATHCRLKDRTIQEFLDGAGI